VQDRATAGAAAAAVNEEGVKTRPVLVWAGVVFNNEQGRAAVLSDARHGGGQRVQKKRMRERLGSRS
jgi:hypothetical protein